MQIYGKKLKGRHMTHKNKKNINEVFLEAHQRGVKQAIDLSIRTGTSLVIEKDGVITEIKPKYKYILVPIQPAKTKRS